MVIRQPQRKTHAPRDRSQDKTLGVIGVFAFVLIPLSTYFFVGDAHLARTNLSSIGNTGGNRPQFILWGGLCAAFFSMAFKLLYALLGCKNRAIRYIPRVACLTLVFTVLIPFLPDADPASAWMHNNCAYATALLAVAAITLFIVELRRLDKRFFTKVMAIWTMNVAIYLALLYKTGISALVEIVFVTTASTLLFILSYKAMRLNGAGGKPLRPQ